MFVDNGFNFPHAPIFYECRVGSKRFLSAQCFKNLCRN